MGTINYKTSDYITLAICPYEREDFKRDKEYMNCVYDYLQYLPEDEINDDEINRVIDNNISEYYDDDYENAKSEIEKHYFRFYHVSLEYGYYEGVQLTIENNFPVCYDDYIDKKEVQKEITELCNMLHEIAGYGFVACFPGWSTGYKDYNGTLEEIKKAKEEMRKEARQIPTWLWYERNQHAKNW